MVELVFGFRPYWGGVPGPLSDPMGCVFAKDVDQAVSRFGEVLERLGPEGCPDAFEILLLGRKDGRRRDGVARRKARTVGYLTVESGAVGDRTMH